MKLPEIKRLASAPLRPRGRAHVRADISVSARMGPCDRADATMRPRGHRPIRADEVIPLSSPSLCTPSLALRGQVVASARTREKIKIKFFLVVEKERKKMFGIWFSIPKFPRFPELRGLVATQDRVFLHYVPNSSIKHSKSDSKDRSQEIL
jgi:hypothetical protein